MYNAFMRRVNKIDQFWDTSKNDPYCVSFNNMELAGPSEWLKYMCALIERVLELRRVIDQIRDIEIFYIIFSHCAQYFTKQLDLFIQVYSIWIFGIGM